MKRSKYNLSHYRLATFDQGELVPVGVVEVLPGDTFQHRSSVLLRVSPLVSPVMHPIQVRLHHWFVPYRLVWTQWEDFITGGSDGLGDGAVMPTSVNTSWALGSLFDYLGVPTTTPLTGVSAPHMLIARAYGLIWNEFYRDQNVQTERVVSKAGGTDSTTDESLASVCWQKDYFTTARPWPQIGAAQSLPIVSNSQNIQLRRTGDLTTNRQLQVKSTNVMELDLAAPGGDENVFFGTETGLAPITIQDIREAFALQRFSEARAQYGSRYTEYLRYLGVQSSDARLQRPEYLGGGKATISFSEILQTADTAAGKVGDLFGHGIAALRSRRYRRYFEEHGVVLTLMSCRPKAIYTQGIDRMWSRRARTDFFQHELANIGQQELYRRELYSEDSNTVFGWQDRYEEYRHQRSQVTGEFRTSVMNDWHLSREFASPPALNSTFLTCTPTKRVHHVQTNDVLWCMIQHDLVARRPVGPGGVR